MAAVVGLEQESIIDCLCQIFPQIGRGAITLIAAGCNFNITECCNILSERENKGCSESTTYMYTICARIVNFIQKGYKVMVLMRGLPGSGKTYLAINLLDRGLGNVNRDEFIFSPDNYFNKSGRYIHNPQELLEVHTRNQRRVYANAKMNVSPIIIDSPNLEIREMKIYCTMAVQLGYIIEIVEIATPWALDPKELALRNIHGVNEEDIKLMLERYERNVNLKQLMKNFELLYAVPLPQFRDHPPLFQISSRDSVVQLMQVYRRSTEEELLDKLMGKLQQSGTTKESNQSELLKIKTSSERDSLENESFQVHFDHNHLPRMMESIGAQSSCFTSAFLAETKERMGVQMASFRHKDSSSIEDGAFRVIGSKMEGVPDSKQLAEIKEIILKHSEETTKMRNEIMNFLTFLTTDIKTSVMVISQQLGEMKQIVMDQSEEVKETVLEHIDEMKETVLDQSEEMKETVRKQSEKTREMLPMQNHRNIQLTSSIEVDGPRKQEKAESKGQHKSMWDSDGQQKLKDLLSKALRLIRSLTKLMFSASIIMTKGKLYQTYQIKERIKLFYNVFQRRTENLCEKCRKNFDSISNAITTRIFVAICNPSMTFQLLNDINEIVTVTTKATIISTIIIAIITIIYYYNIPGFVLLLFLFLSLVYLQ